MNANIATTERVATVRKTRYPKATAEKELTRRKPCGAGLLALAALGCWLSASAAEAPLVTLEYRVMGTQLKVSPSALSVPKDIPGSVLVQLANSDGSTSAATSELGAGAYVEATLRGPAFQARRLVSAPDSPLMLPALSLVGDYQLDNIRLVDSATGAVRLEGNPSSVPVHVFDEVLISKVTSRALTTQEIQEKGIYIDEQNFRAVEFEVGFVLDGKTIPVKFPVVAPTFKQSTEIIPATELEARLVQAQLINSQIASSVELPRELQMARLNMEVQGINFQVVDEKEVDLALRIPPIPALMVIPGNIGYLNQFFSVQVFTENGAPLGSGLSVYNVMARMILPPGPDKVPAATYEQPGDDPLRFARIGTDRIIQPDQQVKRPGADGVPGTADDIPRLQPAESGQAEFLVEGLQEGLHVLNLELTADLDGLAAGPVKVKGKAAGSVLVRNPKFSLAFTHPRTIRAGEPYVATVTILNTSPTLANLVSVTLPQNSISGAALETDASVQLGTIMPGQSATATFRLRSQRTGSIKFSNLTTGEDSVMGRFRLTMGVDERGVALSPDTIAMPGYTTNLPPALLDAANRVLGQALSAATAPLLPAGVRAVSKSIITKRVLELAEAGQRVLYGDPFFRVLPDLMLDWQAGRGFDAGFDQILGITDAGHEWRMALAAEMEKADVADATVRWTSRASDIAGRTEPWVMASATPASVLTCTDESGTATSESSRIAKTLVYPGSNGGWLAGMPGTNGLVRWLFTNEVALADIGAWVFTTNGTGRQFRWTLSDIPAGACYSFALGNGSADLAADTNCDGSAEAIIPGTITAVQELEPELLAALQDRGPYVGRPNPHCLTDIANNYGTVLAVLFSKPMTQGSVNVPSAYRFDNGNAGASVQIQPGGRVALVNMRLPFSALRPRLLTISGVSDARGHPLNVPGRPITSDLVEGIVLRGRVVRADGSVAVGVPVTITMYDEVHTGLDGCKSFTVRNAQLLTDEGGNFVFDFIMAGIPYSVSATDTSGLSLEATRLLMEAATAGAADRERLMALADSASAKNTLLQAFAVAALPEAIVKAEGLDRAMLRDSVVEGSARIGTESVIALRFRGRATVTGQVVAADGVSPVYKAAVNLYPDPDSRELGRGMFSDVGGRFAFYGVPLGRFSIEAISPTRQARTVAGVLDEVGQTNEVLITLSAKEVLRAGIYGRVVEADNTTPHPGAQVYIGPDARTIYATATADSNGYWNATNLPVGMVSVFAISLDGSRSGTRGGIQLSPGAPVQVTVSLPGVATVRGRVQWASGAPVSDALVAGGEVLVRSDANGLFTLTGVPTGNRSVRVGVERNPALGIDFPRLGSASLSVFQGVENYVVVKIGSAGRIVGRVLDVLGRTVPNTRVCIPTSGGFFYTDTDASGNYRFEGMALGGYTLSSPAPDVAKTDVSGLMSQIQSGDEAQIMAAMNEAYAIFTGAADPLLNGKGDTFNPSTWGYTTTSINADGQTAVADIHYLPKGSVSGVVLNGQGVPIGAAVRLTGLGPNLSGAPSIVLLGDATSDPALGVFRFPNSILAGPWGLQAASPFYPTVITLGGRTTPIDLNVTNVVLQFPPVREVNGRLAGYVVYPDGAPAGSDVQVKINFSQDYTIRTDTNGFFDTQIAIPARTYTAEAFDPLTGLRGRASAKVTAGITNYVTVRLLGKGSLQITVIQADGAPATNAAVQVVQGSFPGDRYSGSANAGGILELENLFEGSYAVSASMVIGSGRVSGRAGVTVVPDMPGAVVVRLAATGTIRGRFLERDLVTPVSFAQVAVGSLGYAATDLEGRFELTGVPMGTYRLTAQDAVTGIGATASATLTYEDQVVEVLLVEQARGEIKGLVINSYNNGFVSGAAVTLSVSDGISPSRTVTTGPDGSFSFPGSPAGRFTLRAVDPVTKRSGSASGVLPEDTATYSVNIALQPVGSLAGVVLQPDGVTPAGNTRVTLGFGRTSDTDVNGRVAFSDLGMGGYQIRATALGLAENHSTGFTNATLRSAGETVEFQVILSGVGSVSGQVLKSDGTTPAVGAEVRLMVSGGYFSGYRDTVLADYEGRFEFSNLPTAPYRLVAEQAALAASFSGVIRSNSQADTAELVLGASGALAGRLLRADGTTPAEGVDVVLSFTSQSSTLGRALSRAGADGEFAFQGIPLGTARVEAIATTFSGIARLDTVLSIDGQTNDIGNLVLDEADPQVVAVNPPNTAMDVPTTAPVEVFFSEALDPNTVKGEGIFLRYGNNHVAATVQLLPDPANGVRRLARLTPAAPLLSRKTYDLIVINGNWTDAFGKVARGPLDLVGRPLALPFVSRFTTADNDPPVLVSTFPADGEAQVDPRAVMRLSFNEAIRETGYTVALTGPGGPVAGTPSIGLNGLVLAFTPAAALEPNATYTIRAEGIRDLAGNAALNQPITSSFSTLDTLGPTIATLRLANGRQPVAGATVPVEAILASPEPGVSVRFTKDFVPVGVATGSAYQVSVSLPASGSTTLRAIATDRYGNDGPVAELTLTILDNQPPLVSLARADASDTTVANAQQFTLALSATDDDVVTNLTLVGAGAVSFGASYPDGAARSVPITVPNNAPADSVLRFTARATDSTGQKSAEAALELTVRDVRPPTVTLLSPEPGATLDPAEGLKLKVVTSENSTNCELELVVSGALTATQTVQVAGAPNVSITNVLVVPLTDVPHDGRSLTATVRAVDGAGNVRQVIRSFVLPDAQPPVVALSRVDAGGAWVTNGRTLVISVSASDYSDITNVTLIGTGGIAETTAFTSGGTRQVSFLISNTIPADAAVQVSARAGDRFGNWSGAQVLAFTVVDGAAPGLIVLSPPADALLDPAQPLELVVVSADNSTNHQVSFGLSGALTAAQTLDVFSDPNVWVTNTFEVPLTGAAIDGQGMVATLRAVDARANARQVVRSFRLPDRQPPAWVGVTPTNGAPRQSLWLEEILVSFTEALAPGTVNDASVRLTNSNGQAVEHTLSLTATPPRLAIRPSLPIQPGMSYTARLFPTITDLAGHALTDSDGAALPPDGLVLTFTTAGLTVSSPTNGTRVMAGQTLPVKVSWEPGLGASFFRFQFETNTPVTVAAQAPNTNVEAALQIPPDAVGNRLHIQASRQSYFTQAYEMPPITLDVVFPTGDTDGDGMPDTWELAHRLDPFLNDSGLDPDADGLPNLQEFVAGTDPRNPDTDADNIPDGADPDPLAPNHPPVAGVVAETPALRFDGTNDYLAAPYSAGSPLFTLSSRFTYELWVKPDSAGPLISRQQCSSAWPSMELSLAGTGANLSIQLLLSAANCNCSTAFSSAALVPTNRWSHIAVSYDRSAQAVRMYLDGSLVFTGAYSQALWQPGTPFFIGGVPKPSASCWESYLAGSIRGVAIWKSARSAADIPKDMELGILLSDTNLAAYWPFADGTGQTVADLTPNANPLLLGGGVADAQPAWITTLATHAVSESVTEGRLTLQLAGTDPDADPLTFSITALPQYGTLYQTTDGTTPGEPLTGASRTVTDAQHRVIYVAPLGTNVADRLAYIVNDGFANSVPAFVFLNVVANPATDTDGDGMPDVWEVANRLDPAVPDGALDADQEGLSNLQEYLHHTDPWVPDTDHDGLDDAREVALGSDPLNPDTDSDGLPDGADPDPLHANYAVTFYAPTNVILTEGSSSNITIEITAAAPLSLVDYTPTNMPPAFVSTASKTHAVVGTNGTATVTLVLNPLHDAAGTYVLSLRAAATNGDSGVVDIPVTVEDNPALTATYWKAPVNGSWTDATKWSDGVPVAGKVAVIDAAGAYTVSLSGSASASGVVLNHSEAVLSLTGTPGLSAPFEVRGGTVLIPDSCTFALNSAMVNLGRLRSVSGYRYFTLQGTGYVENLGLWEVYPYPGQPTYYEGIVRLPVNVPVGGTLLVNTNAKLNFAAGSSLNMAGTLDLRTGGNLRLENSSPARDVQLQAGAQWIGLGALDLEGSCRLLLGEDTVLPGKLYLQAGTAIAGNGRFALTGSQSLVGNFNVPIDIVEGAVANFGGSTFRAGVVVKPGGTWTINDSVTVNLNCALTNLGTMKWVSGYRYFTLQGTGYVENLGLWEVYPYPGQPTYYEGIVRLPVNVPVGGTLLVNTNAKLNFAANSSLNMAGTLDLRTGGYLRLENSSPARDVQLQAGAQWIGLGALDLEGSCRLLLSEDTVLPGKLYLQAGTAIAGNGRFALTGSQSLVGNFNVPIDIVEGAVVNFGGSTFRAGVVVKPGGTWTINDSVTVNLNCPLTNLGTMKWVSGYRNFTLQGTGYVENLSLWEVYAYAGQPNYYDSTVRLAVNVPPGGTLLVNTNAKLNFAANSSLNIAGTLDLRTGGNLRLENSSPARDVQLQAGAQWIGLGALDLEGSCRLLLSEDTVLPGKLYLQAGTAIAGNGRFALTGSQSLVGNFNVPIDIVEGAVVNFGGSTFRAGVVVKPGGTWTTSDSVTINLNCPLTNLGTMKWVSGYRNFTLQGTGQVENAGLWEVYAYAGQPNYYDSMVRLPVNVPSGGTLLVSENGRLNFSCSSALTVGGTLDVRAGGVLRLENCGTARDLVLLAGSAVSGSGLIELRGSNRLIAAGDLDSSVAIGINDSCRLQVEGVYTIHSSQGLNGTMDVGLLVVATNGVLSMGNAAINGAVEVQDGGQLRNTSGTVSLSTNVLIQPGGRWLVYGESSTINLNGVLTNRGTMRWISGLRPFNLRGSGRAEIHGVWEVYQDNGNYWSESVVRIPVEVPVGGTFLVNTNGRVNFTTGSRLSVAGEIDVRIGGRLRFDNTAPARDLVIEEWAAITGLGTVELDGSNRLLAAGDLNASAAVNLYDSPVMNVAGSYRVGRSQTMNGTLQIGSLVVPTNVTLTLNGAVLTAPVLVEDGGTLRNAGGTVTFTTNLVVGAGGRWLVNGEYSTINLQGVLTNQGTMRWISGLRPFNLQGTGRVANEGMWEIYQDNPNYWSESVIRVPVDVPAGATLLVNTNGRVNFTAGSTLTMGGELETRNNAILRLDASSPRRDLVFLDGSACYGTGTIQFQGANSAVINGTVIFGGGTLNLIESSSLSGTGLLSVTNGTVRIDHTTSFPGSIALDGTLTLTSGSITFDMGGILTLNPAGIINNPGVIRVVGFVDNGGTINGNVPVVKSGLMPLRISRLVVSTDNQVITAGLGGGSGAAKTVTLDCIGLPGQAFKVEASTDLAHWTQVSASSVEVSPGAFRATVSLPDARYRYFRLSQTSPVVPKN